MMSDFLSILRRERIVLTAIWPDKGAKRAPKSGQFTSPEKASEWAAAMNAEGWNLYWTVNVARDIADRIVAGKRVSGEDIEAVYGFKMDIDPVRPADTMATEAERTASQERVLLPLFAFLRANFTEPMVVESGSGFNVVLRLDPMEKPAKEFQRMCETFMAFLAAKFDVEGVAKLDTTVTDLPRVLALPGTLKRKGESTEDRPYRNVELIGEGTPISPAQFEKTVRRIVELWDDRRVRRWVVKLPRFEQFHNGKLSFAAYLKKYAKLGEKEALRVLNLYTWLRGDPEWDMDTEESDNERMIDETYNTDDGALSIKHLLKDGEPTDVLRALDHVFEINHAAEAIQRHLEKMETEIAAPEIAASGTSESATTPQLKVQDSEVEKPGSQITEAEKASLRGKGIDIAALSNAELNAMIEKAKADESNKLRASLNVRTLETLLEEFSTVELPWIQQPFLLRGEVTILIGAANLGKTTFVIQMLMRGATGNPWFLSQKRSEETFRTLYVSLEMGELPLAKRIKDMYGSKTAMNGNILISTPLALTLDPKTWDAYGRMVTESKIDVVVIDNLLGTDIGFDLNKMRETTALMNDARAFAQMYNVAVLLVHHTRKGQRVDSSAPVADADQVLDEAAGSKVIVNRAAIRLFLQKRSNKRRLYLYSRFGPQRTIRLGWDKETHRWKKSSRDEEDGEEAQDGIENEVNDDAVPRKPRKTVHDKPQMDQEDGPKLGTAPRTVSRSIMMDQDRESYEAGESVGLICPECKAEGRKYDGWMLPAELNAHRGFTHKVKGSPWTSPPRPLAPETPVAPPIARAKAAFKPILPNLLNKTVTRTHVSKQLGIQYTVQMMTLLALELDGQDGLRVIFNEQTDSLEFRGS